MASSQAGERTRSVRCIFASLPLDRDRASLAGSPASREARHTTIALTTFSTPRRRKITTTGFAKSAAATAAAIAAFVPIGRCPACFASATGVAGSIGLSGPAASPWFLLLIGAFLSAGLWGMTTSARAHRRWSAVWAGGVGAGFLLGGRLIGHASVVWAGAALLTIGFVLDLYWKRKASAPKLVCIDGIG